MEQEFRRRSRTGLPTAIGAGLICACAAVQADDAADGGSRATAAGAVSAASASALAIAPTIASISIDTASIFDLDNPDEDGFVYRLANRLHVTTRESVIRQQLLFHEGEPLSIQAIEESERILRDNRFLQDADIEHFTRDSGVVDVSVATSDTWTLMPRIDLSRAGGVNRTGIGVKETNLLGTGIAVEARFQSDVDRDGLELGFADRNIGATWYGVDASIGINSDGHAHRLSIGKPFYSLDAKSANGLTIADTDQLDYLYDGGEIQSSFRHRQQAFEAFLGRSAGLVNGWTRRYTAGIGYDRHRFLPADIGADSFGPVPDERTLLYPFAGIELVEDRYETTRNVSQLQRTEDHHLGTRMSARLGLAARSLGSDRTAALVDGSVRSGLGSFASRALLLSASYSARLEENGLRNRQVSAGAQYYWRQSDHLLFFASLAGTAGSHLDLDNQVLLGGMSGLRGYPLRYLSGDSRALLTIEQRVFTDWYPFRLFHVGAAVFYDAGRVWDSRYPSARNDRVHRDVGVGLRLGNTRSGLGKMIHIDFAYPLDGDSDISNLQLLVQTHSGF